MLRDLQHGCCVEHKGEYVQLWLQPRNKIGGLHMMNRMLMPWEVDTVVFHFECNDGFASALVAYAYVQIYGRKVQFIGVNHHEKDGIGSSLRGKNVLFVDISPTAKCIQEWNMRRYLILDHHDGTEQALTTIPANRKYFDMTRSGCGLAWEYFFPQYEMPTLFKAVEAMDTYHEHLRFSQDAIIMAGMKDVTKWCPSCWLEYTYPHMITHLIRLGTVVDRRITYSVQEYMKRAEERVFKGHRCWVINVTDPSCIDRIGNGLVTQNEKPSKDIALMWRYNMKHKVYKCCLRSAPTVGPELYTIAQEMGGGGGAHAAGFDFQGTSIEELFSVK